MKKGFLLKGHEDYCYSVKFLQWPYVASGSYDKTIKIFDVRKEGQCVFDVHCDAEG